MFYERSSNLKISFPYRVAFTTGAFNPENEALIRLMAPEDESRVIVFLEEALAQCFPELNREIVAYFGSHLPAGAFLGCHLIPGGEQAKSDFRAWEQALRYLVESQLDRHSFILAIGGGAFLDIIGFAASTAHRGIRLLRLPTTTLSQADSGVGVKNGINFMGAKNYLGTFAVPWATLNDSRFLHVQPPALKRSGLAEVVKVALVKEASFFDWIEAHVKELGVCEEKALEYAVEKSAMLHAAHISTSGDPFELGTSRPLDFGHWAAHYLETLSSYTLGHAEAVSVGMCLDILYAVKKGWLANSQANRIFSVLQGLGLPTSHELIGVRGSDGSYSLLKGLDAFREHLGGKLTVLMLHDIGKGQDVHEIDISDMEQCLEELLEH